MFNICGCAKGVEYTRFPSITTVMIEDFVRSKIANILGDNSGNQEVYCFPQVLGDTSGGIKYATMCICMSGITEEDDSIYSKIKQFSYRPKIDRGIQNAVVKAYEFSEAKLRRLLEHPKELRNLSLSPKDIDFLYSNRKLAVHSMQDKSYYSFYADMDRLLDDFLMDADSDDPVIPYYTVIGIKALGDKPNSPLSYDILVTNDPEGEMDNANKVFKALIHK